MDKKSVNKADNLHLHHLINKFLSKYFENNKINNPLTGLLINGVIFLFIMVGINFPNHTNTLVILILIKYNS